MELVANYLYKKGVMKIYVYKVDGKTRQTFVVQVAEGETIYHTEIAHGLKKRDEIVWKLAEEYKVVDIESRESEKPGEFKFSEIPSIPVLDEFEAEDYFERNKDVIYSRILQAVEEGIIADKAIIRLFELNGTGEYLTSNKEDWKEGLYKCIDHFTQNEDYEKCAIATNLISKL